MLFLFSTKSFACSCIESTKSLSEKVIDSYTEATVVFKGKVIDIINPSTSSTSSSFDPIIYKFEIVTKYKGKLKTNTIEVASAASGASCGYEFEMDTTYLVYARQSSQYSDFTTNDMDFVTSLCDRNQKEENIDKKEIRLLSSLLKSPNK